MSLTLSPNVIVSLSLAPLVSLHPSFGAKSPDCHCHLDLGQPPLSPSPPLFPLSFLPFDPPLTEATGMRLTGKAEDAQICYYTKLRGESFDWKTNQSGNLDDTVLMFSVM